MAEFKPDVAALICKELALGKSLARICKEHSIDFHHVYEWLRNEPRFAEDYARAREEQADYLADEIINLIDEKPAMTLNKAGSEVIDSAWVSNQKNRVDARKWVAAKMKPKKYGDAMKLSGDSENPLFPVFKPIIHNASDDGNSSGS